MEVSNFYGVKLFDCFSLCFLYLWKHLKLLLHKHLSMLTEIKTGDKNVPTIFPVHQIKVFSPQDPCQSFPPVHNLRHLLSQHWHYCVSETFLFISASNVTIGQYPWYILPLTLSVLLLCKRWWSLPSCVSLGPPVARCACLLACTGVKCQSWEFCLLLSKHALSPYQLYGLGQVT